MIIKKSYIDYTIGKINMKKICIDPFPLRNPQEECKKKRKEAEDFVELIKDINKKYDQLKRKSGKAIYEKVKSFWKN